MGSFSRNRTGRAWLGRALLTLVVSGVTLGARADEIGSAVYIRADTDDTVVISPQARASMNVTESTAVDLSYIVDVWTSASIDIRTSATKQIAITEQRDEIDLGVSHELDDLTLTGGYRFSIENDYVSHGGSLGASIDLANNAATLAGNVFLSADRVGKVGDPEFDRPLTTLTSSLSFTQVIDPATIVQGNYELGYANGFQSSPYRYVPIGGDGSCAGTANLCVPERAPSTRLRHAFVVQARRALPGTTSLGVGYRFYIDDWALTSHTLQTQFAWLPNDFTTLALRYRFYSQGSTDFFKPRYGLGDLGADYLTFDRELSALSSHRIGIDYFGDFELGQGEMTLRGVVTLGGTHYSYHEFVWLDTVTAFEATVSIALEL